LKTNGKDRNINNVIVLLFNKPFDLQAETVERIWRFCAVIGTFVRFCANVDCDFILQATSWFRFHSFFV